MALAASENGLAPGTATLASGRLAPVPAPDLFGHGHPRTIGDTQCGFKLYRADIARTSTQTYLPRLHVRHRNHLAAVKRGYRIAGFPCVGRMTR